MKKFQKIIAIALLTLMISMGSSNLIYAGGGAPPPPPPPGHGTGGNVPGGGAPVGEGLLILSLLAGVWGTRKVYMTQKKAENM